MALLDVLHLLQLTFFPLFLVGILGQPRRVFEYAPNLQTLNDISSISAYFLGASFFFFIINFIWSIYMNPHEAPPNPWDSLGLEWQTPTPVPWFNFEHIPVVLERPVPLRGARRPAGGRPRPGPVPPTAHPPAGRTPRSSGPAGTVTAIRDPRSCERTGHGHSNPVDNQQFESFAGQLHETPEEIAFELRAQEGALWTGGRLLIGIWAFAFAALAFAYFYLRSANNEDLWRPKGITAPTAVGAAIFAITVACALLGPFGDRRFRAGEALDWEVAGWTAVLGGLLVVGAADLAADRAALLPRVERLRVVLHRVGRDEHRARVVSGAYWLETILAREIRLRRAVAEDGGAPFDAARGPPVPGQSRGLHVLLGLHRPDRAYSSGCCSTSCEAGGEPVITADLAGTQALTFAIPLGVLCRRAAVGLLPAPTDAVNGGAADGRPPSVLAAWRPWCLAGAALRPGRALVPPLWHRWRDAAEYAAALQFSSWPSWFRRW